jgi:hypothetical protein
MSDHVVIVDRLALAPLDDTDPNPHTEYRRGDHLDLDDDNPRTKRLLELRRIVTKDDWDAAQVDPSTLPPSGDITAGRGIAGDRPVLAGDDVESPGDRQAKRQQQAQQQQPSGDQSGGGQTVTSSSSPAPTGDDSGDGKATKK